MCIENVTINTSSYTKQSNTFSIITPLIIIKYIYIHIHKSPFLCKPSKNIIITFPITQYIFQLKYLIITKNIAN